MKKFSMICTAAAALLAVSCGKELVGGQDTDSAVLGEGKTYIEVGTGVTKTYIGEPEASGIRKVYWQNGDKVNVNGVDSEALDNIGEAATSAVFEFNGLLDFPYNVVSPAGVYKDAQTLTLPAQQTYTAGSYDPAAEIAVAYTPASGDAIHLRQVSSVVKLSIAKGTDECALTSLTFTGKNSEQVSGDFTVNYQEATIAGASEAEADKAVTVDMSSVVLSETATEVFICLPAATYSAGFNVRICDAKGHYMDQTKSSSVTLEAGKIYSFPTFTYEPTGTLVEISTADEYLSFAADFKKGVYGKDDKNVNVEVTADLDFTDKTFACVDNDTYKFAGTWHGNGHAMKNITAKNVAMFFTPTGTISDVVIDASCSFSKDATTGGNWGVLARVLNAGGCISGCSVNCDWNFDYGTGGSTLGYGIITGRNDGKVENCTVNGNMIYTRAVATKLTDYLSLGGVVGLQNEKGSMKNCTMNGNLTFNEPADEYKPVCAADKYFQIGGVIGRNLGRIEYLKMTGDVVYKDYVFDTFIGGVVGNSEGTLADHITMEGNVSALQPDATKADGYLRLFIGGVLGRAWKGTVSNCTNVAGKKVAGSSQTNNMNVGGVIGAIGGTAVVQDCVNNMTVEMNDKAPYYAYVGGIIGAANVGTTVNSALNNGPVNVGVIGNTSGSQTHVGGVIGYSNTPLDGGTITNKKSAIHNNAQVLTNAPRACTGFAGANFGGVVGRLDTDAKNLTNSGKVYLNFGDDQDQTSILKYVAGGGVIARVNKAVTVDGCINSGTVQLRYWTSAANNNKINYVGGIVGCVMSGANNGGIAATIKNCISYGNISSSSNNNTYPGYDTSKGITQGKQEGGVVGVIIGTDGARAKVENCKSASTTAHNVGYGYFGCVVGMAIYTDILGCENTTNFTGTDGNGCTVGGILGITNAKVVIRNCKVNCKIDKFQTCGGIAAACNTGGANAAVIEDNQANIVATTGVASPAFGAIARNPVDATVVQGNGIKGSFKGTAFSASYAPYCGTTTFICDPAKPNYIME